MHRILLFFSSFSMVKIPKNVFKKSKLSFIMMPIKANPQQCGDAKLKGLLSS